MILYLIGSAIFGFIVGVIVTIVVINNAIVLW